MLKVNIKSKIYKMKNHQLKALDNVQFEINKPKLVCILGPSGSGKTTLMNIIGALDSDFSGDVIINDKSLKEARNKELDSYRKNTVGFIFQQFYLLNRFNVYDNVAMALTLSNVKDKKKQIMSLLKDVEMDKFYKRKVNVLSGGQKQRGCIARALANNPDIILADEPTGALDSRMGHEIMSMLKKLSKKRIVLVITHSDELTNEFADAIIKMEDGKIVDIIENNKVEIDEEKKSKTITKSVMSYGKAFAHSLKNLWFRKGRTIATAIGMSVGIVGIALAFALSNGSSKLVKAQIDSLMPSNMVTVSLKDTETGKSTMKHMNFSAPALFSAEDVNNIMALDRNMSYYWGVPTFVMEEFFSEVSLSKDDAISAPFNDKSFMCINGPEPYESISGNLTLGRAPENKNEVAISLTTAKTLLGNDDNIDSLINKDLYIKYGPLASIGADDEENTILTFKIVGISSLNTLGNSIYQNSIDTLELYQNLTNVQREKFEFIELYVYLNRNLTSTEIKDVINKINKDQDKFVFMSSAETTMDDVQTFMNAVRNVLIGFSSISVVVAILMIGIVIYISVIERVDEIGILRAIGARKKDIRNLFLSESMIIGFFAGTIGVLVSTGLCSVINLLISSIIKSYGMPFGNSNIAILDPLVAISLILLCILLALIAGLIPSLKAARMDPIVALRRN